MVKYQMTIKIPSYRILVLWITLWTKRMKEQEQEPKESTDLDSKWRFLYWDDYQDYTDEEWHQSIT